MMDHSTSLPAGHALERHALSTTSRYYGLPTAQLTLADGRTCVYVRRRFLPPTGELRAAARAPRSSPATGSTTSPRATSAIREQSWRLCDANGAMRPEALVANVGARCASRCPKACRESPDA